MAFDIRSQNTTGVHNFLLEFSTVINSIASYMLLPPSI